MLRRGIAIFSDSWNITQQSGYWPQAISAMMRRPHRVGARG
jgi:hypothetical protein